MHRPKGFYCMKLIMNKKLFSLTISLLVNFTAATNCMKSFDSLTQDRSNQTLEQHTDKRQTQIQQRTIPTLQQLAIKKVETELVKPEKLNEFIQNPQYAENLIKNFKDKNLGTMSNAIAKRVINNTILPENFLKALCHKKKKIKDHSGPVTAVAFGPNSNLLASASDKMVCLYNLTEKGEAQHASTLRDHSVLVMAVAFSPNSNLLVIASNEKVCLYRLTEKGEAQHASTLRDNSDLVRAVAFSPNSKLLVTASDKMVCLYNLTEKGEAQHVSTLRDHSDFVLAVAFSPNSNLLVTASCDKTVRMYRVTEKGEAQHASTLKDHSDWVMAVAFSPNSNLLASASNEKVCLYCVTEKGEAQHASTLKDNSGWVMKVAFSPNSNLLASASDKTVCLYRVTDKGEAQHVSTLKDHSDWVTAVAFSPNSNLLASASKDKTVCLYDINALHRFIESKDFCVEHALLLHACFKEKVSLEKHSHLREYFFGLQQTIQNNLVKQKYVKLMKTEVFIELAKKHWEKEN